MRYTKKIASTVLGHNHRVMVRSRDYSTVFDINMLKKQYELETYRTYTTFNITCFNNAHSSQVVGRLVETKPILLLHQNGGT